MAFPWIPRLEGVHIAMMRNDARIRLSNIYQEVRRHHQASQERDKGDGRRRSGQQFILRMQARCAGPVRIVNRGHAVKMARCAHAHPVRTALGQYPAGWNVVHANRNVIGKARQIAFGKMPIHRLHRNPFSEVLEQLNLRMIHELGHQQHVPIAVEVIGNVLVERACAAAGTGQTQQRKQESICAVSTSTIIRSRVSKRRG